VNVNTGKLNLSKFSSQLKASNLDLRSLHDSLANLGPEGVSTFNQLSMAIAKTG